MSQKKIHQIRNQIDKIDRKIIVLLGLRKKKVIKIAKYKTKKNIIDKKRIQRIYKKLKILSKKNKLDFRLIKNFWSKLINYSILIEKKLVK